MFRQRTFSNLQKFFRPPHPAVPALPFALPDRDPVASEALQHHEEMRTAVLLRTLLIMIGLAGVISAVMTSLLPKNRLELELICASAIIGVGILLWQLGKGRVRLVAHVVVLMLFVLITATELVMSGRFGADVAAYLLVVVLAGVVLKPRMLVAVTFSSGVAIVLIALIRFQGDFANNIPAQLDVMTYVMLCILMALIVYLSRRGLNKALASSEYYFESLIRTSRDIVTVVGHDRIIQYDSPAIERVLGYGPGQRVGQLLTDYVHADDLESVFQAWQNLETNPELVTPAVVLRSLHADGSWIDTECTAQLIQDRNKQAGTSLLISTRDVRLRKQTEIKLEQRLSFEALVADISSHFMALPVEQIDDGIQHALQRLGEFTGVDLCILFQLSQDRTMNINTHEWCAPGIPPQGALRQELPVAADDGWWLNQLTTHGFIYFADLNAELPTDIAGRIQLSLKAKGLRSVMSVSIVRRGIVLGELGLDSFHKPVHFSDDNVRLLRVVAELIGGALEQQRAATALQIERDHLERRVNERTHELGQLLELSRTISTEQALEPLLALVLAGLKRTVGYTSAAIAELPDGVSVHTLVADGADTTPKIRLSPWIYDLERDVHLRNLMEQHLPALIPEVSADTPFAQAHRARYLRTIGEVPAYLQSSLYLPLVSRDRYIGHVALHSDKPGYFNEARAELAFAFARQAAVAIENVQLHEDAVHGAAMSERRRLARELHDSVSQALFGIVLGSRTAMQLGANSPAVDALKYVLDLSEGALAEMRALIFELRPESLQTDGLLMALDKQSQALAMRHNLAVHLHLGDHEPSMKIEAKEALYRIALEAVQNTIKHAHATEVTLGLEMDLEIQPAMVTLEIADNGRGFDVDMPVHGHYGLRTMRERAEQLGGTIVVDSTPGHGTRVVVVMPMAPELMSPPEAIATSWLAA